MTDRAENESFRLLDDFVCDASHAPGIPLADWKNQGRNEGTRMVEDAVFELDPASPLSKSACQLLETFESLSAGEQHELLVVMLQRSGKAVDELWQSRDGGSADGRPADEG
jgi:hypothetical protein